MEHRNPIEQAEHLRERVQEVSAQFLLTEVQAGLALLQIAETSVSDEANMRRRSLAQDAYHVVSDHLARTGHKEVRLSSEEREEISRLCTELGSRLGQPKA